MATPSVCRRTRVPALLERLPVATSRAPATGSAKATAAGRIALFCAARKTSMPVVVGGWEVRGCTQRYLLSDREPARGLLATPAVSSVSVTPNFDAQGGPT